MNYFLFILKAAFEDFNRNKIKTFLTSLGIFIGVSSVVLLIALGLGLKAYIKQQFESLGTNTLYAMPGNMSRGMASSMTSEIRFDDTDVLSLKKVKNVTAVVPFVSGYASLQGDIDSATYEYAATTADVFDVMNLEIEHGVSFTKSDVEKGAKKVVLGPKVAEKIFGSVEGVVGKTVKIKELVFTVVGIAKAKGGGGLGAPSVDEHIYFPHTAAYSFNPTKKYMMLYIKAANETVIPTIKEDATKTLLKHYKKDDFSVMEQTEILNTINSIFTILNSVLIAIAAISLLVGGVGIMNIMYMSVVERIREIGIRRAIGATKKDILYQFLAEAVLLSGIGGTMGLFFSSIVVLLLQTQFPMYVDASTVAIALGVSSTVGIVFGVFPAKKAADLSPMEAIRYE
ncbi:MAG: ABC transporter permease [Candidatus Gottesmanbacteria bacterium]